ncbi:MAG TPA: TIGR02301 family protein [Methylocystis sp.]|nr:TIGR02301 family protein [Methylocystis sp.]
MSRARALALTAALLAPAAASAQGFPFDLFGGEDRPAVRRAAPQPRRHEAAPERPAGRAPRAHETPRGAKKREAGPPQKAGAPAAPAEAPPAPYDAKLQRLSELLGGLAYLRDLCGFNDGEDWRKMMARLREAETSSGARRQRLTAAFNRGFGGYELTYRACTPNARLVVDRYLAEAEGLAREVASRYGNP